MESYQCMVLFTSSFSIFWFIKTCLWKTLRRCHLLSCRCLGTNEAEKTSEKTLCTFWAFMIINVLIRYPYESLTLNLRGFSRNICVDFFRLLKIVKKRLVFQSFFEPICFLGLCKILVKKNCRFRLQDSWNYLISNQMYWLEH